MLRAQPGERAVYSNVGYIALGEVIAAAAGTAFEGTSGRGSSSAEDVQYRLRLPRARRRRGDRIPAAAASDDAAVPPDPSPRHRRGSPRRWLAFNRFLVDGAAYGGLVGSARDAARFMAVHLGGGQVDRVRILSPESTREMMTTIQATGPKIDVGFGWFRRGPTGDMPTSSSTSAAAAGSGT
ncbi:MAG: serine hydrolase domain-containing protein [Solirubrobacterales bacterium]